MAWEVNNLTFRGGLESILVGISDIYNANSEVVGSLEDNIYTECKL